MRDGTRKYRWATPVNSGTPSPRRKTGSWNRTLFVTGPMVCVTASPWVPPSHFLILYRSLPRSIIPNGGTQEHINRPGIPLPRGMFRWIPSWGSNASMITVHRSVYKQNCMECTHHGKSSVTRYRPSVMSYHPASAWITVPTSATLNSTSTKPTPTRMNMVRIWNIPTLPTPRWCSVQHPPGRAEVSALISRTTLRWKSEMTKIPQVHVK